MFDLCKATACSKAFEYIDFVRVGGDVCWDFFTWLCERTFAGAQADGHVMTIRSRDNTIRFRIIRYKRSNRNTPHKEEQPLCHQWCDYEIVGSHTRAGLLRGYEVASVRELLELAGRINYFDTYDHQF